MIKSIKDFNLESRKVFIRVDFNVPIKAGVVSDDTRIVEAIKSIEYASSKGAKVILASHLGRPKGEHNLDFSLKPVADYINSKSLFPVKFVDDCIGDKVARAIEEMNFGEVLLLENLRFYKGEEKNDLEFTRSLAMPYDIYINDAFGTCHRKHSSTYGMAEVISEVGVGLLVEKEIKYFNSIMTNPKRPFAAILGGLKVSDKIGVIDFLLNIADKVIVGGAMAYTFLKYNGIPVGDSLVEENQMDTVKRLYEKARANNIDILLPIDHIVSDKFGGTSRAIDDIAIPSGFMGLDIGNKTIAMYIDALSDCKTILWNGPMGVFEQADYSKGTFAIAKAISELSNTVTIVGGGDSVSAVVQAGVADKISHISTGGGASLEFLEFGSLPGIDVLDKY